MRSVVWIATGSPPQVRGKPLEPPSTAHKQRITPAGAGKTPPFTEVCRHYDRITPAGAGKTKLIIAYSNEAEDHPRRCGENITSMFLLPVAIGSPPRMRGKREVFGIKVINIRITPADAGKTGI